MWNTPMKRYILLFGLIGLAGCFLPLVGGTSITVMRIHTLRAWLTILAFAIPALVAYRSNAAATVLAGIACFGYLGLRFGTRALDLILYAGIGGKLIGVAIVGGTIATIVTARASGRAAIGALLESKRATR
jgi:hypothetical protein